MNEIIDMLCEIGEVISTIQQHAPIQLGFRHVVEPEHIIVQYPIAFDFYLNHPFSRNKEEIRKAFMSFCRDFHLYVEYLVSYAPSIFVSKLYNDVSIEKEE